MIKFVIAWIGAVGMMTLFSNIIYRISHREVREPILLAWLLKNYRAPNKPVFVPRAKGWLLHFAIGLVFMSLFMGLWMFLGKDASMRWGGIIGAIFGLLGIFGWALLFYLHPQRPKIDFKLFYLQLFLAHSIFGLTAAGLLELISFFEK